MLTIALYLADQNPSRDRSLGITRATLAIAEAICRDVRLVEIVSQSSVRLPPGQAAQTVVLPLRTDGTLGRAVADMVHPALARPRVDVWFYPKGFVTSPVPLGAPSLALVHDTILDHYARHHPGDRPRWQMALWLRRLRTTLRRATRVATVSETARADILAFCARHGIPPPAVDVVYAATPFARTPPQRADPPFALHLGTPAPHKRTAWLVEQWAALARQGHALPALHVAGALPDEAQAAFAALPGSVFHGRVSDDALGALYRDAAVVVVPSEIEGFGLPVLEAFASGTPAVVTAGTALAEILEAGGIAGLTFAPGKPATLADAVAAGVALPDVAGAQGRLLDAFSPERLRERVLAALYAASSGVQTGSGRAAPSPPGVHDQDGGAAASGA